MGLNVINPALAIVNPVFKPQHMAVRKR